MLVEVFPRRNRKSRNDFVVLVLLFVVGWFSTDLVSTLVVQPVQSLVSLVYASILAGLLALGRRRLRLAVKEAQAQEMAIKGEERPIDGFP